MKKFEVGKIYSDGEGIEIEVIKRTEKTITFKYTKKNWWEKDLEKIFRKNIKSYSLEHESISLESHWSAPEITAA